MILFPSPNLSPQQIFSYYQTFPFDMTANPQCGATESSNPTYITSYQYKAFKRLYVTYFYKNTATVSWELANFFADLGPYTFQLQGSQSGTPRGDDWFDIGSTTSNFFATDNGYQRMFGKTPTLYYRVLLNTPTNCYVSPIIGILGLLNKHDWLLAQEISRKEQLNHKIFSSVRGYLLKARRYGQLCTVGRDSGDLDEDEIIDSNCKLCYGTGYVGGYYPATEYYALLDPEKTRESRDSNRGTIKDVVITARFLATLPLIQGDAWVNAGSDERYYVHSVIETAAWKSVPVVYQVELRLAPFTDILYDVPLE